MTATETAVLNAIQGMTSAFQAADIGRVMDSYEPGAVVVFEPEAPVSDTETLTAMFTQMASMSPEFTYGGHEVIVAGDTAMHIAPWSMQATLPDGTAMQQSGLSVAVLRRQSDGSWRMVIDNPHGSRLLTE